MSSSVEKLHSLLRVLSCSRVREMRREPEVPEEEVPVAECVDGLARITSKELTITHFVKSGTLQNAHSARPRVVVGLGNSVHAHTVRLMNNQGKGPKIMMTKVQWLLWRRMSNTMERGEPLKTTLQIHDIWVAYSGYGAAEVFIDFMEELRHTETDPMGKFTKVVARHAFFRERNPSLRNYLPWWTSSACSQCSNMWGLVSGGDRGVEAGQKCVKIEGENKAAFFSPSENWCLLAPSNLKLEERGPFRCVNTHDR